MPPSELPLSTRGAPQHLKSSIRSHQNVQSARRARFRHKNLLNKLSDDIIVASMRITRLEQYLDTLTAIVKSSENNSPSTLKIQAQPVSQTVLCETVPLPSRSLPDVVVEDRKGAAQESCLLLDALNIQSHIGTCELLPQRYHSVDSMQTTIGTSNTSMEFAYTSKRQNSSKSVHSSITQQLEKEIKHGEGSTSSLFRWPSTDCERVTDSLSPLGVQPTRVGELKSATNAP